MKPTPWASSPACHSREHCSTCQDQGEAGRRLRLSLIGNGFTGLPENGDAPTCIWGMEPPPLPKPFDADEVALLEAAANPEGWGDHVAAAIHKVGADKAWKLVRRLAGMNESCGGCNARREALNRLEALVKRTFTAE